jgi:hypothetical protein
MKTKRLLGIGCLLAAASLSAASVTAAEPPPWIDKKTGKAIDWYAGKQYDDDVANAETFMEVGLRLGWALADLLKNKP